MSDPLSIPSGALRTIWLFSVDLPEDELPAFESRVMSAHGEVETWPLQQALGVILVSPDHVELFKAETLSEYSVSRYLVEANGMDAGSVAPDADRLDGLRGPVLLVHSGGLAPDVHRLDPSYPLTLIGRYTEALDFSVRTAPETDSATGVVADPPRKAPSNAAMSGRVATIALLVMFALVGLMIWIAG